MQKWNLVTEAHERFIFQTLQLQASVFHQQQRRKLKTRKVLTAYNAIKLLQSVVTSGTHLVRILQMKSFTRGWTLGLQNKEFMPPPKSIVQRIDLLCVIYGERHTQKPVTYTYLAAEADFLHRIYKWL